MDHEPEVLRDAERLRLMVATAESLYPYRGEPVRVPDLDQWTRSACHDSLRAAAGVGILTAGDHEVLETILKEWSTQPGILRALLSEIVTVILRLQRSPGALEAAAAVWRKRAGS